MLNKTCPPLLLLLIWLLPIPSSLAQNSKATKFDEFGDINSSDLKARLDNFALQLQQRPTTKGFLMVYRSRRDLPGLNISLGIRMREYLLQGGRLPRERIVVVNAGVADHLVQELWIAPPNTAPVAREDSKIGYFHYADTAWKFLEYGFLTPAQLKKFNLETDNKIHDEYLEAFVDEVKKQSGSRACVIVYAQYNPKGGLIDPREEYEPIRDIRLDSPGIAKQRMAREWTVLTKTLGLSSNRVRMINGGYRKQRAIELWVVPEGESLPVPTPNSYPKRNSRSRVKSPL